MKWLERMNEALRYLENNLAGEISYEKAAKLACSSAYHFQRMFSYMAEVPLGEYLRRRRMTLAALDLQEGAKVLDVALKYGYESPTAFNRAFQAVHGIPPSAAQRSGTLLKAYPPITFQITIRGVTEMEFKMAQKDAFRVVGVRDPLLVDAEDSFQRVPIFWQEVAAAGTIPKLCGLMNQQPMGLLGLSTCFGDSQENYYYIAVATDGPVPAGMYEYQVPAAQWAVFSGQGGPAEIQALQRRIATEWLPASGYEWANAPDIEVYLNDTPGDMKFEVWLPVVKKEA